MYNLLKERHQLLRPKSLTSWLLSTKPINIRELIILAGPALLIGFIVRLLFIIAIPQGYFGADSASYYEFTDLFWNKDILFNLNEKRRWFYPLFLFFSSLLPISSWYSVPIIQHIVGLLSILGIGWISAQVVNRPRSIVPLVVLVACLWPRMIWYEHEFIAEALQLTAFIIVLALLITPSITRSHKGFYALMAAFTLLAGMKGSSRFLWVGSVVGLFLLHHDPRRWMWSRFSAFLAALSVLLVSTVGKSSQGDWLALSSSLPLVRREGEPFSKYRSVLESQILEARQYGQNYPWKMKYYKKRLIDEDDDTTFSVEWAELVRDKNMKSKVFRSFWTDAVFNNPLNFARLTFLTFQIALSKSIANARFEPQKFWRGQITNIRIRMEQKPYYYRRPFGVSDNQAILTISKRGSSKNFLAQPLMIGMNQYFGWMKVDRNKSVNKNKGKAGKITYISLKPMGLAAIFGMIGGMIFSTKRLKLMTLFVPLFLYLAGSYSVGDAVSRYLHPVEWLGIVFAGVTIDLCLSLVCLFRNKQGVWQLSH